MQQAKAAARAASVLYSTTTAAPPDYHTARAAVRSLYSYPPHSNYNNDDGVAPPYHLAQQAVLRQHAPQGRPPPYFQDLLS